MPTLDSATWTAPGTHGRGRGVPAATKAVFRRERPQKQNQDTSAEEQPHGGGCGSLGGGGGPRPQGVRRGKGGLGPVGLLFRWLLSRLPPFPVSVCQAPAAHVPSRRASPPHPSSPPRGPRAPREPRLRFSCAVFRPCPAPGSPPWCSVFASGQVRGPSTDRLPPRSRETPTGARPAGDLG